MNVKLRVVTQQDFEKDEVRGGLCREAYVTPRSLAKPRLSTTLA